MHHYSSIYKVKDHHHWTLKHIHSPCLMPLYYCFKKCCSRLPQRYLVAILTAIGITIEYMQRMCLSLMITAMVKAKKAIKQGDACPPYTGSSEENTFEGEFDWDIETQGNILAAFFYGYIITHLPGGIIADLFGGKHIFGATVFLSSVLMIVSPLSAKEGPMYLLTIRLAMGLVQGPLFPAITSLVAHWSPPDERGLMNTITNSGVPLGLVLGNLLSGQLLQLLENWEYPFYIYGVMGIVWYIFWLLFVSPTPKNHPFISEEECNYILDSLHAGAGSQEPVGSIPWKEMLLSKEFIVTTVANLGHETGLFFLAAEMPIYMSIVLHLPTALNGLVCAIPWMCMWIGGFLLGEISSILERKRLMKAVYVRKLFGGLANLFPAVFFLGVIFLGCDYILATASISVGTFFVGAVFCSIRASFLDNAPNFAGIAISIAASVAGAAGFVVPKLVHHLIGKGERIEDWALSFYLVCGFVGISVIPYLIFINANVLSWNYGHVNQPAAS